MNERQTVAGAYQKIESHEDLCAVRYAAIESKLGDLQGSAQRHERAAWGIVLALLAWMGVQLYNDHMKPSAPVQPVAVVAPAH